MARVAVAYVEVRPDTSKFATQLRAALAKVQATVKAKIEPDTRSLARLGRSAPVARAGQQVGATVGKEAGQTIPRSMIAAFKAQAGEIQAQSAAVLSAQMRYAAKLAANDFAKTFGERELISDATAGSIVTRMTRDWGRAGTAAAEAMVRAHNVGVQKLLRQDERAAQRLNAQQSAAARVRARHAAEDFANEYARVFRDRMERVTDDEARQFELEMVDKFGDVGASVARAVVSRIDRDMSRRLGNIGSTGASRFVRNFSNVFAGTGGIGRVAQLAFRGVASIMESTAEVSTKMFGTIAKGMSSMGGSVGQVGEILGQFVGTTGKGASVIGALAGALAGVLAIVSLVGIAVTALNTVFAGLLAVVIPLVAGVTALVAQLGALAAVAVGGGIALLPGIFATAAAAFGPLLVVAERFEELFEDTAEHTGELFVVLERLRNAIWSVLGTGFVKAIQDFVAGPLPKLLGGIENVASAWGDLLVQLVRMAGSTQGLRLINEMLGHGANVVRLFSQLLASVGPALMTLASAAAPALGRVLDIVADLGERFGGWIAGMAGSGALAGFFGQLAVIFEQLGKLVPPLVAITTSWLKELVAPASVFLSLLGGILQRWAAFAASEQGAQMIRDFFAAMNQIVIILAPLVEQLVIAFLRFGPILARLTAAATPALGALIDSFMVLVTAVAPAVERFLSHFAERLSDPAMQQAISDLGIALGEMLTQMTVSGPQLRNLVEGFTLFVKVAGPLVDVMIALDAMMRPFALMVADLASKIVDLAVGAIQPTLWVMDDFDTVVTSLRDSVIDIAERVLIFIENLLHLGGVLTGLAGPFEAAAGAVDWLRDKLGGIGDDAKGAAITTGTAAGGMNKSLDSVANAQHWRVIQQNAQAVGEYMINMANNGIRGNNELINSMAKLAAAAYATKNEADMAQFEKMVGRAYTRPTAQLYAQSVYAKTSGATLGRSASDAFMTEWNKKVDTKIDTKKNVDKAKKAGRSTAAGYLSTLIPHLTSLDAFAVLRSPKAYDTGREMAVYLAKGITSGASNINKVATYIQRNFGKSLTGVINKNKEFWNTSRNIAKALPGFAAAMKKFTSVDQLTAYLAKRQDYYTNLLGDIKQFKANVIQTLSAGADMVGYFGFIPTPAEVKARLSAQLSQIRTFTAQLAALQKKGLSKELAAAWLQAGYDQAGNLVAGLQSATSAEIAQINKTYTDINKTAASSAEAGATNFFGVGQKTVEGYIKGIQSMSKIAQTEMKKLIDAVYRAVKKKLGIRSPSTVFDALGVDTMAGYVQGVAGMTADTVSAVGHVYDAVVNVPPAALTAPTMPAPGYATTAALTRPGTVTQPPQFDVRVFLGDRELRDLVRVEVNEHDSRRARALLAGRRGG